MPTHYFSDTATEETDEEKKNPRDTAAEIVLNRKVQVVASPTHQAFRRADMHTAPLGKASGLDISAQEHFQLANIPGGRSL